MAQVREIDLTRIRQIYREYIKKDFPGSERRPLFAIEKLYRDGLYRSYGFFDGEKLLGYACFILQKSEEYALLDYFAVIQPLRGQGIGSAFITELSEMIPAKKGCFVEAESVEGTKSEEKQLERRRRLNFYTGNGVNMIGAGCLLFHVDYEILFIAGKDAAMSLDEIFSSLEDFYRELYPTGYGSLCKPYRKES